ncbi:unnamed protein product [Toxocara canis]|uniref:Origin recognition complex subunit 5 n=1 Tax=Toxocara canis TaxID=6265 RepID=A0A183TWM6_TOXCA|nr:unnamed protein product [Toxocara canis]
MEMRDSEKMKQIEALLCSKCSNLTHIHLYGLPSTNRDLVLNEAVFVHVNCVLVEGSSRCLCQEIISRLPDSSVGYRINSLQQLFDHIESLLDLHATAKILAIVFTYAEALLRFSSTYLRALFASPKKYSGRVKLVTVSHLPWSNFESVERLSEPLQFAFRSLSKDELLHILCKKVQYGEKFLRLILDTVYQVCRDAKQLEHLVETFWKQNEQICKVFCESETQTTSADYKALQPKLRRCCEDLFYRFDTHSIHQVGGDLVSLPSCVKFLLIAAYCASYNPSSTDRRFFTKNHGKQKRKSVAANRDRNDSAHECGPKSFDLQRLLFIYLSFLEMYGVRKTSCSDIHTQVCELCRMGYLSKTSADSNLDIPKFKCVASFETLSRIAEYFFIEKFVFIC